MSDAATILVVDDDAMIRAATTRLLRHAGHRVLEASDGQQGLALAVAQHPDIVLLDVALPDLSGLEVCRRIRADADLADVFVVMVSGSLTSSDQQAAGLLAGADGYVPRPVGNAELLARVDALLRIRRTELALRLQEKMAAIGTLAAGVAHEVNNPLMGIMGYAQLIQDAFAVDTPLRGYADEIVREAQRVAGIVRSLSSLTERTEGERRQHSLAGIVRQIVTLEEAPLRAEHTRIEVALPTDLPDVICCVPQISHVLLHVLANAREAVNERYPSADPDKIIRISARRLAGAEAGRSACAGGRLAGDPALEDAGPEQPPAGEGWMRLTVEDHGPGIPDAIRSLVFDPFFTTKCRAEHPGLGLTTSRRTVHEHGGRLTVESLVGQWTRVHADLPARRSGPAR